MKRNLLRFIALFFFGFGLMAAQAQGFIHPGILHTQEDLDRAKEQLKDEATYPYVKESYQKLVDSWLANPDRNPNPREWVIRGTGGGQTEDYATCFQDAAGAYQTALLWKLTDDTRYAEASIRIMNAWVNTCVGIGGWTEASLAAGLYGYQFANAGELMRDYEGWSREDFKKFQDWMQYVFLPGNWYFLQQRHGTHYGHYWANWGLCNVLGAMSIGILCDDVFIYNKGLSYYKHDISGAYYEQTGDVIYNYSGYNEYILNLVPRIVEDARGPFGYLGQMQESGRDQGHGLLCVGLAVDICQTGYNQGDDLFAYSDFRIAAGFEHVAAFNVDTSLDLPWTDYSYTDNHGNTWYQSEISLGGSVGASRPYWDRVLGYFHGIQGVEMPYSVLMREKDKAEGGGSQYGSNSGGFDHLGFSTLTCTRPKVERSQAPTPLSANIIYEGVTYERSDYSGVEPGSTLKMIPILPDGVTDTGKWEWNTGDTGRELEVTADKSTLYRVTYTNDKGIKSTQLFSIAVYGDCRTDKVTHYITSNDITINDTVATVLRGTGFTLGVNSVPGYGTFSWSNGGSDNSISVGTGIARDRTYSVVCKNEGGHETLINFHMKVTLVKPTILVDGLDTYETDSIVVNAGQRVTLRTLTVADGGNYNWSDGSTGQTLELGNVTQSGKYSLTYTIEDTQFELTYNVLVATSDKVIDNGEYYIIDPTTQKFLVNDGGSAPLFEGEYTGEKEDAQIWIFARDAGRYKITSKKDYRFLNEYGAFSGNPYDRSWHRYTLHGIEGLDIYAIQNAESAGTNFWKITGSIITGHGGSSREGYPFTIVSVDSYNPTGIERETETKNSIYPNVVTDLLNVFIETECINATFSLYSISGQKVQTFTCIKGHNTIDLSNCKSGIYVAVIEADKQRETFKIVKR